MLQRSLPELNEVVGKYRIVRKLGEGGMGVVFEAVHTRIQQRVAIKMLLPEVLDLPDVVSRFEREARAAGKLKSENTARVLDVDMSERGIPYMVMEFLEGSDLGKVLEQGGALPVAEAVDYVLQACHAMAEAHAAGVIHRDLKPSNLFVAQADGSRRVKVLDFGISKVENDAEARVTATQTVVGTPLYMSPEQVRSAKHVDARTDIWSLGIILYELLAGRTPFEGSTTAAAVAICVDSPPPLSTYRSDVPAGLEQAILRALQKEPSGRFSSVKALADAIAPYGSGAVQAPQGFNAPMAVDSNASHPSLRVPMESARTLPHHSQPEVRVAGGATLPGWTTRGTTHPKRTRWFVASGALVVLAGAAFVVVKLAGANHTANVDTPKTTAPTVTQAPVETIAQPPSVATLEPVPSTTVSAKPQPPPTSTAKPRPTATATTTTTATATAVHTAAPAPTRL